MLDLDNYRTCIQLQIQIIELGNKHPQEAASKHTGRLMKVGFLTKINTGRI